MSRDPSRSYDQDLSPDVAVRWWGGSRNLDLSWRAPSRGDRVHPEGTPLLRVTGILSHDEVRKLYEFLGTLL